MSRALEEAVLVREELSKRIATDPWWQWKPSPWQITFAEAVLNWSGGEHNEFWALCANRAGKSDVAAFCGASLARFGLQSPRFQISHGGDLVVEDYATMGLVVSVDFPNSRDAIQPKFFDNKFARDLGHMPFIPEREVYGGSYEKAWNVTNQILRLKNNSIIAFRSCESGATKIAGQSRDWILFDEEPSERVYEEATIRIGGGRSLLIFGAATLLPPENEAGGVSWLYEKKVKRALAGLEPTTRIFEASIYDNPHLLPKEIARLEAKWPPGTIMHDMRLLGKYHPSVSGARAYVQFDVRTHVKPQSAYNPRRPLCWCWDFNVEPMVSLVGQRIGSTFHVFREFWLDEGNIADMVELFWEHFNGHAGEVWVYGDATGKRRHAVNNRSEYQMIRQHMQMRPLPLRIRVPEVNPPVTNRIDAVNLALRCPQGLSHVEIDSSCEHLIEDMEKVLREGKGLKKSSDRRNPHYRLTHMCLAANTSVLTMDGSKLLKDVRVGDYMVGPCGPGRVVVTSRKRALGKVWKLELSNGKVLFASPQHKFLTERGLVTCDELRYSDNFLTLSHPLCAQAVSLSLASSGIGAREAIISAVHTNTKHVTYTGQFGRLLTGLSRRAITFTTSMETKLTTLWKTCSAYLPGNTLVVTAPQISGYKVAEQLRFFARTKENQQSGIEARKGGSGIASTQSKLQGTTNGLRNFVKGVVNVLWRRIKTPNSVITIVSKSLVNFDSEFLCDLTVAHHHCYVAEGVLVSNSDAFGYWISYEEPVLATSNYGEQRRGATIASPTYSFGTKK